MSIKNLDNLDEAINTIGAGLSPRIIVTTVGTNVYATLGSTKINGVKSGDNYIINLPSTGTWTAYATVGSKTESGTVSVTSIKSYNITLGITTLTGTYWKWNKLTSGYGSKEFSVTCKVRNDSRTSSSLYTNPCGSKSYKTGSVNKTIVFYSKYSYTEDGESYDVYTGTIGGAWGRMRTWVDSGTYYTDGTDANYQYFQITGGSDVTNATLIGYLLKDATQCNSSWNPL